MLGSISKGSLAARLGIRQVVRRDFSLIEGGGVGRVFFFFCIALEFSLERSVVHVNRGRDLQRRGYGLIFHIFVSLKIICSRISKDTWFHNIYLALSCACWLVSSEGFSSLRLDFSTIDVSFLRINVYRENGKPR